MDLSKIKEFDYLNGGRTTFTDNDVVNAYYRAISNSNSWDIGLGFFSLSGLKHLAYPISKFILNNKGKIRVYCNEKLSENDYNILTNGTSYLLNNSKIYNDLKELFVALKGEDNELFSDCISYLIHENLLEIKVLVKKNDEIGISHQKNSIFKDDKNNTVVLFGSANISETALVFNNEDTTAACSFWNESSADKTINDKVKNFETLYKSGNEKWQILPINSEELKSKIDKIGFKKIDNQEIKKSFNKNAFKNKNAFSKQIKEEIDKELLEIDPAYKLIPKFPGGFEPYDYQKTAYKAWADQEKGNYRGIFAMATGTGKTFTSLNCVLNEYKLTKEYNAIILVPTTILVNQWVNDVKAFNFKNIITSNDKNWTQSINKIHLKLSLNKDANFIFISTYATYNKDKFQNIFKRFNNDNLILIADEVHNLGSKKSIKNLLTNINKRIGLSATPSRKYDSEGSLEIEKYFNSYSPCYTYSYSMFKAIEEKRLTDYKYYPYFTTLNKEESSRYQKISKQLLKHFDFKKGIYKKSAEMLLIKRKRIIHQATNKKMILEKIINDLKIKDHNLKHVIVYVPEGFEPDYSNSDNYEIEDDDLRIINDYSKIISNSGLKTHQVLGETKDRERVLKQFEKGDISILTAMKTLDEGVDIPATKYAIFCSSTGNPRQFIQRRGRILRKFPDKEFAYVYDIIVKPNEELFENLHPNVAEDLRKMEENIFRSEIDRVANFLYAAENIGDLLVKNNQNMKELSNLCEDYDVDIYQLIRELEIADKNCY